jgi:hypothetical protein
MQVFVLLHFFDHAHCDLLYEVLIQAIYDAIYQRRKDSKGSKLQRLHKQISLLRQAIGHGDELPESIHGGYRRGAEVKPIRSASPITKPFSSLSFEKWAFRTFEDLPLKLWLGCGILVSVVVIFPAVLFKVTGYRVTWDFANPRFSLSAVQAVVIGVVLAASKSIYVPDQNDFSGDAQRDERARLACGFDDEVKWAAAKNSALDSLSRFTSCWRALLAVWFCLYVVLAISGYLTHAGSEPDVALRLLSNLLNNCNSLALALCFVLLDHPMVSLETGQKTTLLRALHRMTGWGSAAILAFSLLVGLLHRFPLSPEPDFRADLLWSADIVSGLIGGVVLALLVGRIQSKFLNPPTWLPLFLYFYVVIQSLYVLINLKFIGGGAIILTALFLKSLLCLYVAWLYKSGRFLFYLLRVKKTYLRVHPDWTDFFLTLKRKPPETGA